MNSIASGKLDAYGSRIVLPLISPPVFRVTGIELVIAACAHGSVGAFPAVNCPTPEELHGWLATASVRQQYAQETSLATSHNER